MRIMIDIDGVLCELRKEGQSYDEVRINPGAVEKIRALKEAGNYIILQTARHMKTTGGDQGQLMAKIGKKTFDWLDYNSIPYDEIYFGKPNADVYLDDLAQRFSSWDIIRPEDFNSDFVNILIPMAGAGSRFIQEGFHVPKPLIEVRGKTMLEWAMRSFHFLPSLSDYRFIFVVLEEHKLKYQIDQKIKELFGTKAVIVVQRGQLNGQAKTCLLAKDYINNYNKLFIFNCDTFSLSPIWELILKENPDGILECFESVDPRYSFVKLDQYGYVCQTAEKQAISAYASTGMYYFKRGSDFIQSAESLITRGETYNNEFYIIPCYNEMLKSGKKIRNVMANQNWVMGTPEELEKFNSHYRN